MLLPDFYEMLKRKNTVTSLSQKGVVNLPEFSHLAEEIQAGGVTFSVENERPYVLKRDGAIVLGTIDRLVLALKKGKPVAADILDFKTDRFFGSKKSWTAEKVQHYGPQLEDYRAAVSQCFKILPEHISRRLLLLETDTVASAE